LLFDTMETSRSRCSAAGYRLLVCTPGKKPMLTHPRFRWILKELLEQDNPVTGSYLAEQLGISSRTIRADINQLTRQLAEKQIELLSIRGRGYQLPHTDRRKALTILNNTAAAAYEIPTLPEDRIQFILKHLLFATDAVTMDELAEQLYVSRSTIAKDLVEVEKCLTDQNLQLIRKPSVGIQVQGEEIALRSAFANCNLTPAAADRESFRSAVENLLDPGSLSALHQILHKLGDSPHLHLSDRGYTNLLSYLAVSIHRINSGHTIPPGPETHPLQPGPEYAAAVEIASAIEHSLGISFTGTELIQLAKQLRQTVSYTHSSPEKVSHQPDKNLYELANIILSTVQTRFHEDFSQDTELINSLAGTIDSLQHRGKYHLQRENPVLKEIGREYPHALEMAVSASKTIGNHCGFEITEDEISEIALYFCASLERRKISQSKAVSVAFICSTGIGGSQLLRVKFERLFPGVVIKGIFPSFRIQEARKLNPDFFISTIPIEEEKVPVITVSRLLNEADFLSIRSRIGDSRDPDSTRSRETFLDLFHPELFETGINLSSREDVITCLSARLVKLGLVEESFTRAVLEREALCSTAIGNAVAIPHALSSRSGESKIAAGILNRSIPWGEDRVRLVFLLNIHTNANNQLKRLYGHFYDLISSNDKIQRLIRADTFHSFMQVLQG
ncbi:MAG: transcription antiterminator, partial [Anaerolineales bacterium]|nr:transcription antiterminator [Anaerolineales bacterium]